MVTEPTIKLSGLTVETTIKEVATALAQSNSETQGEFFNEFYIALADACDDSEHRMNIQVSAIYESMGELVKALLFNNAMIKEKQNGMDNRG